MNQRKVFQKYFLLASFLMCLFVFLGFFLVSFLMEAMRPTREFPAPLYFARIIDRLNPTEKVEPPKNTMGAIFPFIGMGSLILSLLLGVGTTLAIVYHRVRNGVQQADHVIAQLHKGNLKARFNIQRSDEFGRAMERFNFMAAEIENLVTDLKNIDQKRTQLLQELAHDLRTPIASLKNLNETLEYKRASLSSEVQDELLGLSKKEIYYFERLVEDLLFLAQIKEPTLYESQNRPSIILTDLITDEAEDCILRHEHQGKRIELIQQFPESSVDIRGDSYMIRRLFRNALENASTFTKDKISIFITTENQTNSLHIAIEDNGSGFSREAMVHFGNRRVSRKLENKPDGRLSVGLGSVVMKTICEAHRGKIIVSNRLDGDQILGARVEISLPLATSINSPVQVSA